MAAAIAGVIQQHDPFDMPWNAASRMQDVIETSEGVITLIDFEFSTDHLDSVKALALRPARTSTTLARTQDTAASALHSTPSWKAKYGAWMGAAPTIEEYEDAMPHQNARHARPAVHPASATATSGWPTLFWMTRSNPRCQGRDSSDFGD